MRYINKGNVPPIISEYRRMRNHAGQNISYESFEEKEALNEILRTEQRQICCYCMQRITHYGNPNEGGSHNEHLIPQNGDEGNPDLEMAYDNIYASCNYTKDLPDADSYCGQHKHHSLIADFIRRANCREIFKYNVIGEILPIGAYEREEEFINNEEGLPQGQKEALKTIRILNLNHTELKKKRHDLIVSFIPAIKGITRQSAQAKVQIMNHLNPLPSFVELNIYYLNRVN